MEAEEAYADALKIDPLFAPAMECMGALFLKRTDREPSSDLATAKAWFLKALKSGKSARLWTFLGTTLAALGDTGGAEDGFRQALRLDPNYEEAYFNLALLIADRDRDEAMRLLEPAVDLDPGYAEAHQQLGILKQKEGDSLAAEYHFRRCVELDPTDYWSHLYLANALALQNRTSEAEESYGRAVKLQPQNSAGLEFFANFLDSISRRAEAKQLRKIASQFKS